MGEYAAWERAPGQWSLRNRHTGDVVTDEHGRVPFWGTREEAEAAGLRLTQLRAAGMGGPPAAGPAIAGWAGLLVGWVVGTIALGLLLGLAIVVLRAIF